MKKKNDFSDYSKNINVPAGAVNSNFYKKEGVTMEKNVKRLIIAGASIVALTVASFIVFDMETVKGNEVGVLETWSKGVDENPLNAKTYFLFPGFTQKIYKYPLSLQVFVMNDTPSTTEAGAGREKDAYLVQSSEGQDMHVSLNVQWRIDPTKVIEIHKTVRDNIEEKLLRPVVMRVVKDQATKRTAIEAYSGEGLVRLQNDIFKALAEKDGELRNSGVIVENFVIEGIRLHPEYVKQIVDRQVAIQGKLRAEEQTRQAEAEALKVKAESQADLNRQVVAAERDKQVGVLNAEKQAKMAVLAAEADKQKVTLAAEAEKAKLVLEATGNRDASLLQAEGILAKGKAEAEAKKLQLSAYAVPGADSFVKIEVAKSLADSTKEIKGYLPSDMNIFTLSSNFDKAVNNVVGGTVAGQQANQQK